MTLCVFPREISVSGMHRLHQTRPDKMTVLCFVLEGKSTQSQTLTESWWVKKKIFWKKHITVSEFYVHIMEVNMVQNNWTFSVWTKKEKRETSFFVLYRRKKKVIQVRNGMSVSKCWQNLNSRVNYSFKSSNLFNKQNTSYWNFIREINVTNVNNKTAFHLCRSWLW